MKTIAGIHQETHAANFKNIDICVDCMVELSLQHTHYKDVLVQLKSFINTGMTEYDFKHKAIELIFNLKGI